MPNPALTLSHEQSSREQCMVVAGSLRRPLDVCFDV
jgi:hypothetical protein